MKLSYGAIAGQSLERLAALSDGIFAVAMTLLVLDLRIPVNEITQLGAAHSEQFLLNGLVDLMPRLLTYLMSFMTLGIFWLGQQTQFSYFAHTNRALSWIHLVFLLAVSLLPFSTGLLAEFITFRLAVIVYWLNLLLLGAMLFVSWRYAATANLLTEETTDEICRINEKRILTYQALYGLAAALCLINPALSIAALIFFQLNAVMGGRRLLDRFLAPAVTVK